eukprot:TRINITY_DN11609_c0_g2_i1.p1 TRINITY_DN11609_c0_g2~~TRINITY_DN11609_c0_g2_i1.p1  ORF type:complete len:546 (-),score=103.46 TRINITY_DN11609_c0_g2_i1:57-1694(-)
MSDAWVIDQAASGNITRQGLCWSRDPSQPDYLALTTGPCLPFTVIAVAASNPYPAGVKVIQQFEAGSVSQILQDYRNQSTAARNDFFVADLGFSGMRRFQPLGNNYWSNEDRLYYVNLSNNTLPSLIRLREEQDEIAKSKNSYTVDNIENVFVENNAEDFERNQNQESTTIIDRTVYRTIESIGDRPPLFHQPQPQPIPPRRMFTTFEPGAIGFPFIPNPDIESSAFGFIQVAFITTQMESSSLIFSFRHHRGCDVYMTPQGNLGVVCAFSNKNSFCKFNMQKSPALDAAEVWYVGMLYSTVKDIPSILYVNGQAIGECPTFESYDIRMASGRLSAFWEPGMWRYSARVAGIRHFILMTGDRDKLMQLAGIPLGAQTGKAMYRDLWAAPEGSLLTTISRSYSFTSVSLYSGYSLKEVVPVACSRRRCKLTVQSTTGTTDVSMRVLVEANYPLEFLSEDAGQPGPFRDSIVLTDGMQDLDMSFQLTYSKKASSEAGSKLELSDGDFARYMCKESCCMNLRQILNDANAKANANANTNVNADGLLAS